MRRERTVVARTPACRTPGHHDREAWARGVCRSCYQSAHQLVAAGVHTWKQLEDRGKVLPVVTPIKTWLLS
jgi:hypothetical protein